MSRLHSLKLRFRAGFSFVGSALVICGVYWNYVEAAEARPTDGKLAESHAQKSEGKKLSGAELYSIHCNRCHAERYPTERTAAQWKTILMHMRIRANLPAEQSRTILKYLQENSGR